MRSRQCVVDSDSLARNVLLCCPILGNIVGGPGATRRLLQATVLTVFVGLVGVLFFVISVAVGYQLASRDRIKPGVAVLGIEVGGLTEQEAQAHLAPAIVAIADQ